MVRESQGSLKFRRNLWTALGRACRERRGWQGASRHQPQLVRGASSRRYKKASMLTPLLFQKFMTRTA